MTETPFDGVSVAQEPRKRRFVITSEPGQYKGRLLPIIIGSALLLQTLNATVITTALPTMAVALHESPLTLNMAITVFLLSSAVCLPISGWAADRFGARTVFVAAIATYIVSSVLCGLSTTLWQLIAGRVMQGMAGAMMMPVGRLVLLKSVAKSDLVRAMSWLTVPALLGPVLGPPLGGFIVTFFSWPWIFFINVPIGLIALLLVLNFVPNIREERAQKLDVKGFLLTGVGLAGLIYGLENVGRGLLPWWAVTLLVAGGAGAMAIYVRHEKTTPHPMLDLSLFKIHTFTVSVLGGIFARMIIGATPFLLALLLQIGFGMSALAAGMLTFATAAGSLLMKATAQPIIRKFGFRQTLIVNGVLVGLTFMAYGLFTKTTPAAIILLVLVVNGFLRSLQFTALQTLTFADIAPERMSRASTLSSMGQPLSQSIGIGLSALLVHLVMSLHGVEGDGAIAPHMITPAFFIIGACSLVSLFFFVPLAKDAASEVSGHRHPG